MGRGDDVNRLRNFHWFPPCPDGHRWYACKHDEPNLRPIGFGIMAVGAANVAAGIVRLFS